MPESPLWLESIVAMADLPDVAKEAAFSEASSRSLVYVQRELPDETIAALLSKLEVSPFLLRGPQIR